MNPYEQEKQDRKDKLRRTRVAKREAGRVVREPCGVFLPGVRVSAKYGGMYGTIIVPSQAMLDDGFLPSDVPVRWDRGSTMWIEADLLRRL